MIGRFIALLASLAAGVAAGACSGGGDSAPQPASTGADSGTRLGFPARCADLGLSEGDCQGWMNAVLPALPSAKGNRFGDDEGAARLGFALFFDSRALSRPGANVSCARCHSPERGFADQLPLSLGLSSTARNAPALVNVARSYPHFWDGRADSLWSQPLMTIENPAEMDGTRLGAVHFVQDVYRAGYEKVFGPLPDFSDASRFPAQGKPGTAAWEAMSPADRDAVNAVYANIGKALEAYERKIAGGKSNLDRFIEGRLELSANAARGIQVFTKAGCPQCHSGPNFADGRYHNLDVPASGYLAKTANDPGRAAGVSLLLAFEFNSLSKYYDRAPGEVPRLEEDTTTSSFDPAGAFLTPSLRSVGDTGPYGHNGAFATLEEVVRFHLAGGGPGCKDPLLVRHALSDDDVAALIELLGALHGDTAPLPWSFWPSTSPGSPYPDAGADGGMAPPGDAGGDR